MAISKTAADIRPLAGYSSRRFDVASGATVTAGDVVYIDTAGDIQRAKADAKANSRGRGIAVADRDGDTTFNAGDAVDVVVNGPVTGYASMSEGEPVFVDGDGGSGAGPGSMVQTAPDTSVTGSATAFQFVVGFAESATDIYVSPQASEPSTST